MKSKFSNMRNTSSLLGVLILINVILVGCSKKNITTAKDETSVGIGCSTTSNGIDNLPNITGYPIVGTNQTKFYNNSTEITAPTIGSAFMEKMQRTQKMYHTMLIMAMVLLPIWLRA
jgi:hypothetical protein